MFDLQLTGDIEIDESLFGSKCKYMQGNTTSGIKVWIFGLISRETNTIILYPVEKRDSATLIPIIQYHVPQGSRIFSDSWPVYGQLNDLGYNHFSVCHKETSRRNTKTR